MNLKYEILFIITVLNDYYTDGVCTDLTIMPTAQTALVLKGQQMLCKNIGNNMIILVKVDDTGKLYVPFKPLSKLSFYISIDNVHFGNFTNITFQPSTQSKYYFTNINEVKSGSALYVNSKVPVYNSAATYAIGALVSDAGVNIYEAIKPSASGSPHAVTDTKYWTLKGVMQYVNSNDIQKFVADTYTFTTTANKDFTIDIYGLNTATNVYDVSLINTIQQHFNTTQTAVQVDLSSLPYGKYKITVNGSSTYVYYDNDAVNQNILGVLEVFNHLAAANDFSLIDNTGAPKGTVFTLNFANRSAIWKYIARSNDLTAIKDNTSTYSFTNVATNTFISTVPIPFKDKPISSLFLESATLGNITPVANPGSEMLSTITQGSDVYYCAEKYLNY